MIDGDLHFNCVLKNNWVLQPNKIPESSSDKRTHIVQRTYNISKWIPFCIYVHLSNSGSLLVNLKRQIMRIFLSQCY
jgi:hypothetical protein